MNTNTTVRHQRLYILFLAIMLPLSLASVAWGKADGVSSQEKCDSCMKDESCRNRVKGIVKAIIEGKLPVAKELMGSTTGPKESNIWEMVAMLAQCNEHKINVSRTSYSRKPYGHWFGSYADCPAGTYGQYELATQVHLLLLQCYYEYLDAKQPVSMSPSAQTDIDPSSLVRPAQPAPSIQSPRLPGWAKVGIGLGAGLLLSGAVAGGVLGWSESRWTSASQAR